jgi:hypothetical protein
LPRLQRFVLLLQVSERCSASITKQSAVDGTTPAHQMNRDAAEIGGFASATRRNARHHVGDGILSLAMMPGHVALDPAGQDGVAW